MSYKMWLTKQCDKHAKIVYKLLQRGYAKTKIIDYFEYENMRQNEADFCPLYKDKTRCHDIVYLNCYLCACPNFRFSDLGIRKTNGKTEYSHCAVNSTDGKQSEFNGQIHQDCSGCTLPHEKKYIAKHFKKELKEIMKNCEL